MNTPDRQKKPTFILSANHRFDLLKIFSKTSDNGDNYRTLTEFWQTVTKKYRSLHKSKAYWEFQKYTDLKKIALKKILENERALYTLASLLIPQKNDNGYTKAPYRNLTGFNMEHEEVSHFEPMDDERLIPAMIDFIDKKISKDEETATGSEMSNLERDRTIVSKINKALITEDPNVKNEIITDVIDNLLQLGVNPLMIRTLATSIGEDFSEEKLLEIKNYLDEIESVNERILVGNLNQVCYFCTPSVCRGANAQEAIQYGVIGLAKAIDVYNYRSRRPFYIFCWHHIANYIQRGLINHNSEIALPVGKSEEVKKFLKAKRFAYTKYGNENPETIRLIYNEQFGMDITLEEIQALESYARLNDTVSIDEELLDTRRAIIDSMDAEDPHTPESMLIRKPNMQGIFMAARLSAREIQVLNLRFWHEKTLEETGQALKRKGSKVPQNGVTKARVVQIQAGALGKLREYIKKKCPELSF